MTKYTEGDVLNVLADLENGIALATATARYDIPHNTLHGRLSGPGLDTAH